MAVTTERPTFDQVIDYLTNRLEGMTMPGAVRMTTAARDYLAELEQVTQERDAAVNQVERTVERYVSLGPYDRLRELSKADQAIGREIFLPNDGVRGTVEGFRAWKDGSITFILVDGRHRYSLSSDLVYKFLVGREENEQ